MLKGFRDFHLQKTIQHLISTEMREFLIFPHIPYTGITYSMYCIHELVVKTRQVDSVAQLVRALHRNRRAAGLIPVRGPI